MLIEPKNKCPICDRELLNGSSINKHHLIPKSKKGKNDETVVIHKICHDKIHSIWRESELKKYYHTIDRICSDPEMKKFIEWVSNKPADFYMTTKMHSYRKR